MIVLELFSTTGWKGKKGEVKRRKREKKKEKDVEKGDRGRGSTEVRESVSYRSLRMHGS